MLGVLQNSPLDSVGSPRIISEIDGFKFRADHWNPGLSVRFAEVSVRDQESVVLEAYIYHWPQRIGSNLLFDRRVWLRRFDFAGRADWVPLIAGLHAEESSPEAFYSWFARVVQC